MSQVIKEYHVSYESDFETEINQILVRITPDLDRRFDPNLVIGEGY